MGSNLADPKVMSVVKELRYRISCKYIVRDFRLFGSSARGDRRSYSDIDVFVRLPELNPAIEEDLFDIAYDLELAHDCVIDLIAVSDEQIKSYNTGIPFFRNILSEGISI